MQVGETFRAKAAATGRGVELVRVATGGAKPEKLVGTALKSKATQAVTVASANAWMGKVGKGQARAAAALASAAAACPNQQIVLAGYSQGATALHRSLASFQSAYGARLMGAILVGDADKVRGTNATIVGAPAASRRGRGIGTRLLGNTVDAPASATGTPVISVCSKGDVVCDLRGNPAGKAVEKHRGYGSGAGAAAVASAAASMWSRVASWARASVTTVRVPLNQPFSRQLTADVDPGLGALRRVVADQRSARLGVPQPQRTAHRHRTGRGGELRRSATRSGPPTRRRPTPTARSSSPPRTRSRW